MELEHLFTWKFVSRARIVSYLKKKKKRRGTREMEGTPRRLLLDIPIVSVFENMSVSSSNVRYKEAEDIGCHLEYLRDQRYKGDHESWKLFCSREKP